MGLEHDDQNGRPEATSIDSPRFHTRRNITPEEFLIELAEGRVDQSSNCYEAIYQSIIDSGVTTLPSGLYDYHFFSTGANPVFGLHQAKRKIVEYIYQSAQTGNQENGLLLLAESGAGKNALVNKIGSGFEAYMQQHSVYQIAGCPIHESPVNLWYEDAKVREKFAGKQYKLRPLCAHCSNAVGSDQVVIERRRYSMEDNNGLVKLASLYSRDSKHSDQLGEMILASNNGILEIPELSRQNKEFLLDLNDLLRGREWSHKRRRFILDNFIISHMTNDEYTIMSKDPDLKTFFNRFEIIRIPYNLDVDSERRIYIKGLGKYPIFYTEVAEKSERQIHVPVATLTLFAELAIGSRINEPEEDEWLENGIYSVADKIEYYSQRITILPTKAKKLLDAESKSEKPDGTFGISPSEMIALVSNRISSAHIEGTCLNPYQALEDLADSDINPHNSDDYDLLEILSDRIDLWVVDTFRKAYLPGYKAMREDLRLQYTKRLFQLVNNEKKERDAYTGGEVIIDFSIVDEIETKGGISSDREARARFRQEFINLITNLGVNAKDMTFDDLPARLSVGIDSILFEEDKIKKMVNILLELEYEKSQSGGEFPKLRVFTNDENKALDFRSKLLNDYGLCEECLLVVLRRAQTANLL